MFIKAVNCLFKTAFGILRKLDSHSLSHKFTIGYFPYLCGIRHYILCRLTAFRQIFQNFLSVECFQQGYSYIPVLKHLILHIENDSPYSIIECGQIHFIFFRLLRLPCFHFIAIYFPFQYRITYIFRAVCYLDIDTFRNGTAFTFIMIISHKIDIIFMFPAVLAYTERSV